MSTEKFHGTSFSAFVDYVKLNPKVLSSVHCEKKLAPKIAEILRKHNATWLKSRVVQAAPGEGFAYEVGICALGEEEFHEVVQVNQPSCLLALEEVVDPRNVGAIVRTAAFYGIPYLVVKKDHQALLSHIVVNTAQAGFAVVRLVVVVNLPRFLGKMKKNGFWIIGTGVNGEPVEKVAGFYEKNILVFGSEGRGLKLNTVKICDRIVGLIGAPGGVQSLNVSVAAGVMMHYFRAE